DCQRSPDGAAAEVRALLRPRGGAELLADRDDVEVPLDPAGLRVEPEYLAARAEVTTGLPDDQRPVEVRRRAREEVAELVVAGVRLPGDAPGALVETDDVAVGLRHEHLAVADHDAAARRQARGEPLRVLRLVEPEPLTGHRVEGEDVPFRIRHVHRAAVDDRLGF